MKKIYCICILFSLLFNEQDFQSEQIKLLKSKHENLLNIFSGIEEWNFSNHSNLLDDDKIKKDFYDALEIYNLTLSLALDNPDFMLYTSLEFTVTFISGF